MKIPISKTIISQEICEEVTKTLQSGWLVQGKKVKEFEERWCQFTGAQHSVAVTSCTSALEVSLRALGFGPGDEAIVPAFTWVSTANVVELLGGKVKFCDIDLSTFNISTSMAKELITEKTKVILPVHLFGQCADMTNLMSIIKGKDIYVVEDAACGFGSYSEHNKHVGTIGNTGCFSFHPRKGITTGEGGMVTTNDKYLADKIRCLRDHGAVTTDLQRHMGQKPYLLSDHVEAAYNMRMTDIHATLGCEQMKFAEDILEERRSIAEKYKKGIHWGNNLMHQRGNSAKHGYQSFACIFNPDETEKAVMTKDIEKIGEINEKRNQLMEQLQVSGISTRPATHAVHMLKYYKDKYDIDECDFICSKAANDCSISLPLYNGITDNEIQYVIDKVNEYIKS